MKRKAEAKGSVQRMSERASTSRGSITCTSRRRRSSSSRSSSGTRRASGWSASRSRRAHDPQGTWFARRQPGGPRLDGRAQPAQGRALRAGGRRSSTAVIEALRSERLPHRAGDEHPRPPSLLHARPGGQSASSCPTEPFDGGRRAASAQDARDIHKILVICSGPIVIGQACEFDYSGVQACKVLRAEGYEVILVNSNPATIMTDPDSPTAPTSSRSPRSTSPRSSSARSPTRAFRRWAARPG